MTNAVYQTTVEELESVLSPRVVSRSLHEGLQQLGKSPETVEFGDIEKILKAQVYRRLQVTMPVTQAKEKVAAILQRLQRLDTGEPIEQDEDSRTLETQARTLETLKEAMKPFNLYFEWPETQKLRAQIQLLDSEQRAGKIAPQLLANAQSQLELVEQKLEDQLVAQARELTDLEAALEHVKTLGGTRVNRLERLIGQVRQAQEARQLAPAEVERARKIATDLRKLLESSVVERETPSEDSVTDDGLLDIDRGDKMMLDINPDELPAEVSARLLLLDVESERHELDALQETFQNLLSYQPEWRERFQRYRDALEAQQSLGENLGELKVRLEERQAELRETLTGELRGVQRDLKALPESSDKQELGINLHITLGVLESTLPAPEDVQQLRDRHQLILEQSQVREPATDKPARRNRELDQQAEVLAGLAQERQRYHQAGLSEEELHPFDEALAILQEAHARGLVDPEGLSATRTAGATLEEMLASRATDQAERQLAQLRGLLHQLHALPALETLKGRVQEIIETLEEQLDKLADGPLDEATLDSAASRTQALQEEAQAHYQERLDRLTPRAEALAEETLFERLRSAYASLQEGTFADLDALERDIKSAYKARRSEQVNDLHRLESELNKHRGLRAEELDTLEVQLKRARQATEAGELSSDLDQGWILLEQLQARLERRAETFIPRLDAALEAFKPVAKLNSEDSLSVKRILQHLDGQRNAFHKVSLGVQEQLESSLAQAEGLLESLHEEYEATRAVADQLVSANILDDILGGAFGGLGETPSAASAETPASPPLDPVQVDRVDRVDKPCDHDSLQAWLQGYLSMPQVASAILMADGNLVCGRATFACEALQPTLDEFVQDLDTLGAELQLGNLRMVTLETPQQALIASWPAPSYCAIITLTDVSELHTVMTALEHNLGELQRQLSDTAHS